MPIFSKHIPRKQSIELPFITTWTTTYDGQPITLPLVSGYNYDFIVDWGDASPTDHITDYNQTERQPSNKVSTKRILTGIHKITANDVKT